ncbi:hypothetical protein ACFWBH_38275 [Streptomyces sp. NPDC059999]|uniref:hypothetical protein n=1 Tax=unclassified Streptomyces TaxID=2593676 RepID=UPI002E37DC72|nr:hypothetical protein [Streptomyces sp. NBC_01426]
MAHAAPTAHRRHRGTTTDRTHDLSKGAMVRALLAGLVYGVWAAFIKRQMGPVDVGNVFYGILCGALFAAIMFTLGRIGSRLPRELHAAAYGVFGGVAVGYLYSLTGDSVLRSAGLGIAVAAATGLTAFYRYYMREP